MEQQTEDVLLSIFAKLTAYDIIRASFTCRSLRAVVTSAAHLISPSSNVSLLWKVPTERPDCWAYDPSRHAWLFFALGFLTPFEVLYGDLLASDGGLACLEAVQVTNESNSVVVQQAVVIFNPILLSKRLIFFPQEMPVLEAVGIKYNGDSDGYELYALVQSSETLHAMLRCASSTSAWTFMSSVTVAEGISVQSRTILICNSVSYTVWMKQGVPKLFALHGCEWHEVKLPFMSEFSIHRVFLMDVGGILHIVRVKYDMEDMHIARLRSIYIWRLQTNNRMWVKVIKMGDGLIRAFRKRITHAACLDCVGKNGTIYFAVRGHTFWDVLVYEMYTNRWRWMEQRECHDNSMVIFEPSVTAVA
ncbi:hypothetical protein KP509_12G065800 [Ceratopteris richardii]|uniref:F-box domain-containing protein n=1 Tax=Ceratopteris richardii TaxID=49495 RepID=A0A8T2TLT0_CERRI|nr:hypothetical protein KP509_12G065800 [Ceratopteris richardii]